LKKVWEKNQDEHADGEKGPEVGLRHGKFETVG